MRIAPCLAGVACSLLVITSLAGCARFVKSVEFQDDAAVTKLANDLVQVENRNPGKVRKVAVAGYAVVSFVTSGTTGYFGLDMLNAIDDVKSIVTSRSATAGEVAMAQGMGVLQKAGFSVTPLKDMLQNPVYKSGGSDGFVGWTFVGGTRYFSRDGWLYCGNDTELQQIMDALKVDGLILTTQAANGNDCQSGSLSLYVRGDGGKARLGWQGKIGVYGRDMLPPPADEPNAARFATTTTMTNSFRMLVDRLARDTR
jgi:hypothetical protein